MKEVIQHEINLSNHLLKNGPRFCTHKGIAGDETMTFRPTTQSMFFAFLYFGMGAILIAIAAIVFHKMSKIDLPLFICGFGLSLIILGIIVAGDYVALIKFDKNSGYFQKKKFRPVKLKDVTGLQINEKRMLGYVAYELNLLTKGGRRINILNHGSLEQIRMDIEKLGDFLDLEAKNIRDYTKAASES